MSALDRWFKLSAAGTTVRREILAGCVTFVTLSYILFVQPQLLGITGMDPAGVLFATCVASALACFAMAALTNYPFALAPAMGHNVFFTFTVCGLAMGFRWEEALAANLLAGLVFLLLAISGFQDRVMHAMPASLKFAIAAGIGLLIALVGLEWAGFVVDHPAVYVQLGDLGEPTALLAIFGLTVTGILLVRKVPGAILIGVLVTALAGWLASRSLALEPPLVAIDRIVGAVPSPSGTAFRLDFGGLFSHSFVDWFIVIVIFLILDFFDTIGTLIGVSDRAGFLVEGQLPRARGALTADAGGTIAGALLGTSTITTYVESAAGVASGGRTGLTAVATGLCMLGAMFFAPLIHAIGAGVNIGSGDAVTMRYPVIAPVLILVGVLMFGAARRIDWEDFAEAIPAFLTVVMMQLTMSITDGIAWGFISHSVLSLATGRIRRTSPLVHVFAVIFVLRYVFLV